MSETRLGHKAKGKKGGVYKAMLVFQPITQNTHSTLGEKGGVTDRK